MSQKLKKNKTIPVSLNNKKKSLPSIKQKKKIASFEILNPATLTKIGELPLYSSEMVEEKILLAKQAQIIWSAKSLRERARELILFRKFLANNKEEMISCICNETGKTKMDALLEIFTTLEAIDYIASNRGVVTDAIYPEAVRMVSFEKS
jgi:acyl-CoA reductase-like NAD-dependent aldehyde dehydrogenase